MSPINIFVIRSTDETPPTIEQCPASGIKYVDTVDTNTQEVILGGNATAASGKSIVSSTVTPSSFTLSKDTLYDVVNVKQEVTDDQGITAECSFQYLIKRECHYHNTCL